MTQPLTSPRSLIAGFGSGLVSGITLAIFAALSEYKIGEPVSKTYTFLASAVAGDSILTSSLAVPLGVLVLFAGTTLWAFGYVYTAQKQPQLVTRPLFSGSFFGFIVWFVNQAVLAVSGHFTGLNMDIIVRDLTGFVVFYGLPMAFVAARLMRAR
jgi:hypothetical protein